MRLTWSESSDFSKITTIILEHIRGWAETRPLKSAGFNGKLQTKLDKFRWQTHCQGLYQLPAAA